jgi:hypothetical protein
VKKVEELTGFPEMLDGERPPEVLHRAHLPSLAGAWGASLFGAKPPHHSKRDLHQHCTRAGGSRRPAPAAACCVCLCQPRHLPEAPTGCCITFLIFAHTVNHPPLDIANCLYHSLAWASQPPCLLPSCSVRQAPTCSTSLTCHCACTPVAMQLMREHAQTCHRHLAALGLHSAQVQLPSSWSPPILLPP